jgi:hypothetical protein
LRRALREARSLKNEKNSVKISVYLLPILSLS